jgi:hypothetical protein
MKSPTIPPIMPATMVPTNVGDGIAEITVTAGTIDVDDGVNNTLVAVVFVIVDGTTDTVGDGTGRNEREGIDIVDVAVVAIGRVGNGVAIAQRDEPPASQVQLPPF